MSNSSNSNGNMALATTTRAQQPLASQEVSTLAMHFVNSGFFKDVRDVSQAVVKAQLGIEFGLGPMTAMMNVYLVEGKPSMGAHLIGALVRKAGYDYRVPKNTNEECRIVFFDRAGKEMGDSVFTIADAQRANLTGKDNWKKYPKAMLFSRAMSHGAKMHCADATMGVVYTPDELGAEIEITESGELLSVLTPPSSLPPAKPRQAQPAPVRVVEPSTGEIIEGHAVSLGPDYENPLWAQDLPGGSDEELFAGETSPVTASADGPSEKQVKAIYSIGRATRRLSESQVDDLCCEIYGVRPIELTKKEASDLISRWQAEANGK